MLQRPDCLQLHFGCCMSFAGGEFKGRSPWTGTQLTSAIVWLKFDIFTMTVFKYEGGAAMDTHCSCNYFPVAWGLHVFETESVNRLMLLVSLQALPSSPLFISSLLGLSSPWRAGVSSNHTGKVNVYWAAASSALWGFTLDWQAADVFSCFLKNFKVTSLKSSHTDGTFSHL